MTGIDIDMQDRGGYEHLATKADLKDLENRLMRTLIGSIALATTIIIAVQRLWQ